jgi:type IV pilus assembly protein PilA
MPNSTKKQAGFTLIELLIVIAIIGILAGIVVSIINVQEYQKQARDARRMNDMLSIQTAIIDSVANKTIVLTDTMACTECTSTNGTNAIDGSGWVKFNNTTGRGLIDIISVLPTDPINDGTYYFSYFSNGNDFELNMTFESERYQINAEQDGGNDPNVYERGFNLNLH